MQNKTALVTGANRGLGLSTCRTLAQKGFRVFLTSRNEQAGQRAAAGLSGEGRVEYLPLDVSDDKSIARLEQEIQRRKVWIDVLVNNAGIALRGFDAHIAAKTLDVNFSGALHVTEALLPHMADDSNIVMVSSGLGALSSVSPELQAKFTDPALMRKALVDLMRSFVEAVKLGRHAQDGWPSSAYAVSKVGLNALVRILAPQLQSKNIRINSVCPGWVRTDMGGAGATRSVEEGAASILWAALLEKGGPTGGVFRDGKPISW